MEIYKLRRYNQINEQQNYTQAKLRRLERQRQAYELYQKNKSYIETAEILGISQGTVRRWVALYNNEKIINKPTEENAKINQVLYGALGLLEKRLMLADKYHSKLIYLLEQTAQDEEMSAKERQAIYNAISDLDVIKIGDLTTIITKLIDKNTKSDDIEKINENIEVVIKDV